MILQTLYPVSLNAQVRVKSPSEVSVLVKKIESLHILLVIYTTALSLLMVAAR